MDTTKTQSPPKAKLPGFQPFKGEVLERKKGRARVFLSNGRQNVILRECPTEIADLLEQGKQFNLTLTLAD